MPQARTAARGQIARAEVNGKGKTVPFRGLVLALPSKAPGEVLFDIGDDNITGTLRTILGDDQLRKVRESIAKDKLPLDKTVDELTNLVTTIFTDVYGITPGE